MAYFIPKFLMKNSSKFKLEGQKLQLWCLVQQFIRVMLYFIVKLTSSKVTRIVPLQAKPEIRQKKFHPPIYWVPWVQICLGVCNFVALWPVANKSSIISAACYGIGPFGSKPFLQMAHIMIQVGAVFSATTVGIQQIKSLSKLAPFAGGPWNLPHIFTST